MLGIRRSIGTTSERLCRADVDQQRTTLSPCLGHRDGKVLFRIVERLERAVVDPHDEQTAIVERNPRRSGLWHFSLDVERKS